MARRRLKDAVVVGRLRGILPAAEAHGDDHDAGLVGGVGGGCEKVGVGVVVGLDEENVGPRSDGVGPLDVQRDLRGPTAVRRRGRAAAGLVHLREARGVGKAEDLIELVQVVGYVRIVVGVHDGDGRPSAVGRDRTAVVANLVKPVGVSDLGGQSPRRADCRQRRAAAVRRKGNVERFQE